MMQAFRANGITDYEMSLFPKTYLGQTFDCNQVVHRFKEKHSNLMIIGEDYERRMAVADKVIEDLELNMTVEKSILHYYFTSYAQKGVSKLVLIDLFSRLIFDDLKKGIEEAKSTASKGKVTIVFLDGVSLASEMLFEKSVKEFFELIKEVADNGNEFNTYLVIGDDRYFYRPAENCLTNYSTVVLTDTSFSIERYSESYTKLNRFIGMNDSEVREGLDRIFMVMQNRKIVPYIPYPITIIKE